MLEIDKALLKGKDDARVKITSPALTDKTIYAGYTKRGDKKEAVFKAKLKEKSAGKSQD